jgi:NAD(P)-dependent dehydrogenase (short-subunit alcohol dehydrogenase family)
VITGASAGIGKATAIEMAKLGYSVVMLVRDSDKSRQAAEEIRARSGSSDVAIVYVDMSSRDSIVRAAAELKRSIEGIDVLINNAGVFKRKHELSPDGIEMTLAVNFVGPFLLTELLLPLMEGRDGARIVNISSENYRNGKLAMGDPAGESKYNGSKAYAASKLMVVMFTRELARRLEGTGITANSLHPGVVNSEAFREYPGWFTAMLGPFLSKPEQGAHAVVHVATAPELADVSLSLIHI